MDIIAFHNSCPDGFTAAYVCKLRYPEAKLLPLDHGAALDLEKFRDKDVLMVDFSLRTREQNDELAKIANTFRILDHHKTAQAVLDSAPYAIFDINRSGAGLAWDYLLGHEKPLIWNASDKIKYREGKDRPWYVDYVEDRDLWRFKLPESEAVNAYIMTFEYTIQEWDRMTKVDLRDAITAGKNIQLQINKYVRECVKQAQAGALTVHGKYYSVGIVNLPYMNTSDVGDALAHRFDIGLGWFERQDSIYQFSARSLGDVDVSIVAKYFGGGGHMHASGWQLPISEGRKLIDTILNR